MVDVLDPTALTGVRTGNLSVSAEDNTVYLVTQDGAIPSTGSRVLTTLDDTQLTPVGPDWLEVRGALAFLSTPGAPIAVGDSEREGRLRGSFNGDNQLMQIDLHSHKAVVQKTPAFPAGAAFHVDFINQVYWTGRGKLDFTDLITFTGDNKRTYFSSSGVMQTAATNAPRLNYKYNGSIWVPKGLLAEPAATNRLLQSGWAGAASGTPGTAPTSWSFGVSGGTFTATPVALSANRLTFAVSAARHYVRQSSASVSASTNYCFSSYVYSNTGIEIGEILVTSSSPAGSTVSYWANGAVVASSYVPVAGDRIAIVLAVSTTPGTTELRAGAGVTSNQSGTVALEYPQFEVGTFPTSYIPTTTANAARAADIAVITGTNFSSWFNPSEGTFVAEFEPYAASGSVFVFSVSDGTNNNRMQVQPWSSRQGQIVNGGVDQALFDNGTISANAANKVALAYKANDSALSLGGAAPATDASVTLPTVDRLLFGNATSGTSVINGHIARLTYYPTRLSNAQLQTLST